MRTLVIVDLQKDFYDPSGALYVKGGEKVVEEIRKLILTDLQINQVIFTVDWHTPEDFSFKKNGGEWPIHCLQHSEGASLPKEVLEAAEIDGAGEVRVFFDLILPIASSITSVMVLFYAVGHWNNYIDAYIFNIDKNFYPLQTVINGLLDATASGEGEVVLEQMRLATQIKFTSIIVATAPILILYPMIEKHFGQGVLVGSFK